jgi:t-SNARE complex subunit (syntaxin)
VRIPQENTGRKSRFFKVLIILLVILAILQILAKVISSVVNIKKYTKGEGLK